MAFAYYTENYRNYLYIFHKIFSFRRSSHESIREKYLQRKSVYAQKNHKTIEFKPVKKRAKVDCESSFFVVNGTRKKNVAPIYCNMHENPKNNYSAYICSRLLSVDDEYTAVAWELLCLKMFLCFFF